MSTDTTPTAVNPHRAEPRGALLPAHPFRPAAFGSGLALVLLGAAFLAQQTELTTLGTAPVLLLVAVALALTLGGIAVGWARREPVPSAADEVSDEPTGAGPPRLGEGSGGD